MALPVAAASTMLSTCTMAVTGAVTVTVAVVRTMAMAVANDEFRGHLGPDGCGLL